MGRSNRCLQLVLSLVGYVTISISVVVVVFLLGNILAVNNVKILKKFIKTSLLPCRRTPIQLRVPEMRAGLAGGTSSSLMWFEIGFGSQGLSILS